MSVAKFIRKIVKTKPKPNYKIEFEPFCTLKYKHFDSEWFGIAKDLAASNYIEISIQSNDPENCIEREKLAMRNFIGEIDSTMDKIFNFMEENFNESNYLKKKEELRRMYHLAAISLQVDGTNFWIALEPGDVESIYNFFQRFTILEGKIVWTNLG